MREAIGNTFIVNLLLVFLGVMSIIFIGSISYSKAFKVKNRIVYVIEKYGGWNELATDEGIDPAKLEISASLKQIGYPLATTFGRCARYQKRDNDVETTIVYGEDPGDIDYHYCVYKYKSDRGVYYGVVTFMRFDIPLIGDLLEFPVYGETKSLYDTKEYYNN